MFGPAEKMRVARRLAAIALGVDVEDLPPDAEVECALGEDKVLRVHARVRRPASVAASVGRITITGRFTP